MAIKIGDNFEYGGKKFLDSRQSFDTLEAMHAFPTTSLPEGFIAYCKEDQKRYEFINNEWKEYTVTVVLSNGEGENGEEGVHINIADLATKQEVQAVEDMLGGKSLRYVTQAEYDALSDEEKDDDTIAWTITDAKIDIGEIDLSEYATIEYVDEAIKDVIINEEPNGSSGDCSYFGDEEPEDDEQIWFSSSTSASSDISYDNPIISELFACIRTLQEQVVSLQAEVEYLKINGGGGIPEWPDMPGPDDPTAKDVYLALEDGDLFLWEDGSQIVLEEPEIIDVVRESVIALEDGSLFLLEDGGYILLEEQVITVEDNIMLLEDGSHALWDDGSNIQLERNY